MGNEFRSWKEGVEVWLKRLGVRGVAWIGSGAGLEEVGK